MLHFPLNLMRNSGVCKTVFGVFSVLVSGLPQPAAAADRPTRHASCFRKSRAKRLQPLKLRRWAGHAVDRRHANPPPEKRCFVHLHRVAEQAFPGCSIRFFSHGTLGGHRAPRINTLAFRLVDARGRFRSNVIWVAPQDLRGSGR